MRFASRYLAVRSPACVVFYDWESGARQLVPIARALRLHGPVQSRRLALVGHPLGIGGEVFRQPCRLQRPRPLLQPDPVGEDIGQLDDRVGADLSGR